MAKKDKIVATLNNGGVRNMTDDLGNVWTYYGPQLWVSSIEQAKSIVANGLYN